jgi:hypothetical protein
MTPSAGATSPPCLARWTLTWSGVRQKGTRTSPAAPPGGDRMRSCRIFHQAGHRVGRFRLPLRAVSRCWPHGRCRRSLHRDLQADRPKPQRPGLPRMADKRRQGHELPAIRRYRATAKGDGSAVTAPPCAPMADHADEPRDGHPWLGLHWRICRVARVSNWPGPQRVSRTCPFTLAERARRTASATSST